MQAAVLQKNQRHSTDLQPGDPVAVLTTTMYLHVDMHLQECSDPMERSAPSERFQSRMTTGRDLAAGSTRASNNPPGYTGHIAASKYVGRLIPRRCVAYQDSVVPLACTYGPLFLALLLPGGSHARTVVLRQWMTSLVLPGATSCLSGLWSHN
jgi:hypothetical protein